jgi:hypothetical protein
MDQAIRDHYGPLFMSHVKKTRTCWIWTGYIRTITYKRVTPAYYGAYCVRLKPKQITFFAHRFSYELHVGDIADGLHLDHLCQNTICVNPKHLEPVTLKENLHRAANSPASINAKKTQCPKGHLYSGYNLMVTAKGRQCRTCANANTRERRRKLRLKAEQ